MARVSREDNRHGDATIAQFCDSIIEGIQKVRQLLTNEEWSDAKDSLRGIDADTWALVEGLEDEPNGH